MKSFLDTDWYKIKMAYFAKAYFPDAIVKYKFINRGNQEYIDSDFVDIFNKYCCFIDTDEYKFILSHLPPYAADVMKHSDFGWTANSISNISYTENGGIKEFEVTDLWHKAIFFEIMVLSSMSEAYSRSIPSVFNTMALRLEDKIDYILTYAPEAKIVDFGTRRRHSYDWHLFVLNKLKMSNVNLVGTSNVHFSQKLNLPLFGSFAHELPMVCSGLLGDTDENLRNSQKKVFRMWENLFWGGANIALTDTFTNDFFFENDFRDIANWNGLRHDSGDPLVFAERAIKGWTDLGYNPQQKTIVFSDGLKPHLIADLYKTFNKKCNLIFGWGTNLTNDVGFKSPNIVMKAIEVDGNPIVKLSDNPNKTTGEPNAVQRYKKIFTNEL